VLWDSKRIVFALSVSPCSAAASQSLILSAEQFTDALGDATQDFACAVLPLS